MNADKKTWVEIVKEEDLPKVSEKDLALLSKVSKPPATLPTELAQKWYSYMVAGAIKNDSEFYDILPEEILKHIDNDYSNLALDLQEEFAGNTGLTIMQIGCGRGDLLMRLGKLGFTNLYGIDRSILQVQGTERKLAEAGVTTATVIQCIVQDFDFAQLGKKIDVVILNNFWGILNQADMVKMVEKLIACMSENGKFYAGPLRMGNKKKRPPFLKMLWQSIRRMYDLKKVERKFGINMFYNVNVNFRAYGFKSDIIPCKNAKYHYVRHVRQPKQA